MQQKGNIKHSKAPWRSTFNSAKERGVRNEGGFICYLPKPHHYTGQDARYNKELRENEADQELIAAAPDMLELLQSIAYPTPGSDAAKWTIYDVEMKAKELIEIIESRISK